MPAPRAGHSRSGSGGGAVSLSGTGVATPVLGIAPTIVAPGGAVTVTVAGGPGNTTDWVALAKVGDANNVCLDWKYLNNTRTAPSPGRTSATLTFNMPTTAGSYQFRFFANGGYTKLATSPAVTVTGKRRRR